MIEAVEAALGPIDVLVNSAGAAKRYAPDDLTAAAWHDAMEAKFFSYIHPLGIVVRRMAARGRGLRGHRRSRGIDPSRGADHHSDDPWPQERRAS
jgi:NAD(P)-dependent dehydrogenase (short-subunit alcohol dehydrogenase family)